MNDDIFQNADESLDEFFNSPEVEQILSVWKYGKDARKIITQNENFQKFALTYIAIKHLAKKLEDDCFPPIDIKMIHRKSFPEDMIVNITSDEICVKSETLEVLKQFDNITNFTVTENTISIIFHNVFNVTYIHE